ncbi:hypothetical protein Lepto7376_3815 [[Leptolyngbya] sp. PCC 7376]|uniref:hypothetical protein n=1 Tax=[Leptolyngbya] sp. PCC 7376 TaxID=111781 RepID=UPI00029EF1B5|nr:hypothetical protein [[Leptolyngbya] sp. PCC 7376]AFY39975.1 hypothetical protein Lepto7376_3815 [[Leptolyngbya] sp. PCC 7376]
MAVPNDDQLQKLVMEAHATELGTPKYIRLIDRIFIGVMNSKKLWKSKEVFYEDALQEALEYCLQNLTEYVEQYSKLQRFMTWINDWVRKKLRLYRDRQNRQRKRQINIYSADKDKDDLLEELPSRTDLNPSLSMWNELLEWIETDPEKVLISRKCKRFAFINAQVLLLRKLSLDNTSWETVAEDLGCPTSEGKYLAQWYSRYCNPIIREWGENKGFI